jgi:hypothetical protein
LNCNAKERDPAVDGLAKHWKRWQEAKKQICEEVGSWRIFPIKPYEREVMLNPILMLFFLCFLCLSLMELFLFSVD